MHFQTGYVQKTKTNTNTVQEILAEMLHCIT